MATAIYLISPPKINLLTFEKDLAKILETGLVSVFQLRLKDYNFLAIEKIANSLKKICRDNGCSFLLNDHLDIALQNDLDGVHLGQEDYNKLTNIKSLPIDFLTGISCYDSIDLALDAEKKGFNYVSFGAFFETKTKKSIGNPKSKIISEFSYKSPLPIVAIGGINDKNCEELIKNGADFLAVISYIWNSSNKIESLKILYNKIHETKSAN